MGYCGLTHPGLMLGAALLLGTALLLLTPAALSAAQHADMVGFSEFPLPAGLESFRADFERQMSTGGESGSLHFKQPGRWRMDLAAPITQTIITTDSLMLIVYPDDGRAVRVHLSRPCPPPSHFGPLYVMDVPAILAGAQFEVVGTALRGDTATTRWSTAEPTDPVIEVELIAVSGCTTRITWLRDSAMVRDIGILYASDSLMACLPVKIIERSPMETTATVYTGVAYNSAVDDSLFLQALPDCLSVEERRW